MAKRELSPAQEKFFTRYIHKTLLADLQQATAGGNARFGHAVLDAEIAKAIDDAKASQPQLVAWHIPEAAAFAQEAGKLSHDHTALADTSGDDPRRALLDRAEALNHRIAKAVDAHKDGHRARLSDIEAMFRRAELAFQDIDDASFAAGQAASIFDYLASVRDAIEDAAGFDSATLPRLKTMVIKAQSLVSEAEIASKTNAEVIELLRKLDLIIQQNGGEKAPLAAVFDEHKSEHADLSRRWHTMLLPDAVAAVRDLAARIDADVDRSRVLLARRAN